MLPIHVSYSNHALQQTFAMSATDNATVGKHRDKKKEGKEDRDITHVEKTPLVLT